MQVLKLMENFRKEEVHEAVGNALRLGTLSFDAIKHLLLSRIEGHPRRLDLKLPTFLREYGNWQPGAPPRAWTTPTTCSDWPSLNS